MECLASLFGRRSLRRAGRGLLAGLSAGLLVLAVGCGTQRVDPARPVRPEQLPGFPADTLEGLNQALSRQCALKAPPAPWPRLCAELPAAAGLQAWIARRFVAVPSRDPERAEGLLTGYFEPLLTGSLSRESAAQIPLLAPPEDLLTIDLSSVEPRLKGMRLRGRLEGRRVVPYDSREQIDAWGRSAPAAVAYVDSAVDAFFLEIQGSGRVKLRDGSTLRVGYADQNGHPYRAIGKTLIAEHGVRADAVSAPFIRQWLREHPDKARRVMQSNPSKVFFRALPPAADADAGPPGSLNVPLTPMRSVATDPRHIPAGSLVYIDAVNPLDGTPLQRVVLAQDTGGAITGAARADLFWGFGPEAERGAGLMKSPLKVWVLTPTESPKAAD